MKETFTHHLEVIGKTSAFEVHVEKLQEIDAITTYAIRFSATQPFEPHPTTIRWKIPAVNVKGVWKPTTDFNKRIMDDWELDHMESRISVDAPVISLFGHDDLNTLTFACADAIHTTSLNAVYREEDNHYYCHISFFVEKHHSIADYSTLLYIDQRQQHFSKSLEEVSNWWASFEHLKPISVPDIAKVPLYSTWYQYHQELDTSEIIKECEIAVDLGYGLIIIDDGWQTNDNNRGYDYTGDWEPDRIPEMAAFVAAIHATGMKMALWYSVPFCGKKSKAFQKFKNKLLTKDHRWAPVFDPRYPEVRAHLITIYSQALQDWNLDGFKLDFIDEFRTYPDTVLTKENGRDYASVNEAVDRLMSDVIDALHRINSEVVIEFRQKYTGPAMRKYGNMFRAFDCPGDATMNRVRINDLKMLSGTTAVHSDMFTYHPDEPLEIKALQLLNTLFGVPQLSIKLQETSTEELAMIRFYTQYWNTNADVLLNGDFTPSGPLANYPTVRSVKKKKTIIGLYDDYIITLNKITSLVDIINAKISKGVFLECKDNFGTYQASIYDCQGKLIRETPIILHQGVIKIDAPPSGLICLKK